MSFGDQGWGDRNGSKNSVLLSWLITTCALAWRWQHGPVACVNVTKTVENFQSRPKCYHFTATQTFVTVSVKQYEHDKVTPLHVFSWFQRNKDDITIVAQHVRDLFTTAAERPSFRRDWNASAIWNREFSNMHLQIFYQDVWHARQALTKWRIKVAKANSKWYVEYVQLV